MRETNKYYQQLVSRNLDLTADNLLAIMTQDVEDILTEWGRMGPLNIHRRIIRTLIDIREMSERVSLRRQRQLFQQEDTLKQYLHVWRTVWLLEGRSL